jgi:asparagine synthase (glutamine-hydrolysing)
MPGIIGLISKRPRQESERELQTMVAAVSHEPFYERGTWIDEPLGVYVGWVAHKDSFADGMPVANDHGDVTLVFSGEEYPAPETTQILRDSGHGLHGKTPSYLVHLYEQDPDFPVGLNGMFHGLVADRGRGVVKLFNDRYGMHRLYYHETRDAFYFAAEAKAILAVRSDLRRIDPRGLGEFVSCGCVLEERTLFPGIHLMPGAASWVFRRSAIDLKGTYFQTKEWEQQPPLDPESYYRELRDVFARNVPRYFNGGQPIGVALTGGLDTRAIMAWTPARPGTLSCYTFNSSIRDNQDVRVARRVSRLCGQSHGAIPVGSEFLSAFGDYAERTVYLTDGCLDVAHAPDLYVSEKARAIAPVKVVGTYGSEVLSSVPAFKPVTLQGGLFRPDLLKYVNEAEQTYARLRREHPTTFAAFRQSPWWHHGILALEQTQLTVRSPYLDNDIIRTVYRAPSDGPSRDVRFRLIRDGNPALARIPTDRGVGGNGAALSRAASRALLGFALKAEYAYDYGMPQWLARIDHGLSALHLERLFLGRHKAFHFRVWYRDDLASYVRQMLLDRQTLSRPYLVPTAVEHVVRGHLAGNWNFTRELHKLLTLELVQRQLIEAR